MEGRIFSVAAQHGRNRADELFTYLTFKDLPKGLRAFKERADVLMRERTDEHAIRGSFLDETKMVLDKSWNRSEKEETKGGLEVRGMVQDEAANAYRESMAKVDTYLDAKAKAAGYNPAEPIIKQGDKAIAKALLDLRAAIMEARPGPDPIRRIPVFRMTADEVRELLVSKSAKAEKPVKTGTTKVRVRKPAKHKR